MELTAVILAAGEAKRMRSRQPKVLHPLCGRPLIAYALRTARAVAERTVVVIGPNAAAVRAAADAGVTFVEQRERLGTGHALEQARAACGDGPVVVLAGDMPLLSSETLERLVSHHRTTSAAATVLTAVVDRPQGYGRILRQGGRVLDRLMTDGVTIVDPASTYIDDTVTIGPDTTIHPQVVLEGATAIGTECAIASGCHLTSSRLGDRVILKPYCVLTESVVDDGAVLGPFCHLRPTSHVGAGAEIGNFIELKKTRVGRRTKAHHVGYLGDAIIGDHVNIGAGTIFVNYDGVAKHQTTVGDGAFVGSNSSLVAPLTIGEGAYIAAGSVITKDVPADALVLERSPQVVKEGWAARRREKQAARQKG